MTSNSENTNSEKATGRNASTFSKKVLVTGGAGYIGSHTVRHLLNIGYEVFVIDDLSTGSELVLDRRSHFTKCKIDDRKQVQDLITKNSIDSVIHFAASTEVAKSVSQPYEFYQNNTVASLEFIEVCRDAGVKNFVFSSTAAVYKDPGSHKVKETSALEPSSPYGRSKLMTEYILQDLSKVMNMKWMVLRYFNVAGASQDLQIGQLGANHTMLVKMAAEAAAGVRESLSIYGTDFHTKDGTGVRDYIYIEEIAELHQLALDHLEQGKDSEILNCGYGKGYSVHQVIETMKKVSGVDFLVFEKERRTGDIAEVVSDNTKLKEIFGWKPKYDDLELICRTAYEWEVKMKGTWVS